MNNIDVPPVSRMRAFWNRIHFTNLYREVLDKGCKIRIKGKDSDGIYWIETYKKRGWWIFSIREIQHTYLLNPSAKCINQVRMVWG